MKKKCLFLIVLCSLFLTGCFGNKNDVLKDINKKYGDLKAYTLTGDLQINNNDDVYNYDVKVFYKKKDNYYVSLKNRGNNHEQIILRNESNVYVITPSLNKSFKFQSDWPYNNSQSYLITSILDDINKDDKRNLVESKDSYTYTTDVNYPNNRKLVKQIVVFDKDYNLKSVSIVDENDVVGMKMTFQTIDLKPININNDRFDINKIIDTSKNNEDVKSDKPTATLDDVIYPLYLPTGTVLTNSEKINKSDGERVIMTFEGEKPFLLVEETASIEDEFSIIPTFGEPGILIDTVGALTDSSITWSSNGIDYYIVSDVMGKEELLEIARSVNVIPVMK